MWKSRRIQNLEFHTGEQKPEKENLPYEELAWYAMQAGSHDSIITFDEEVYQHEKQEGKNPYADPTKGFEDLNSFTYTPSGFEKFILFMGYLKAGKLLATIITVPAYFQISNSSRYVLLAMFFLVVVVLPIRATFSKLEVNLASITVRNPFRTYKFDPFEAQLVYKDFHFMGATAGWTPYGAPLNNNLENSTQVILQNRPALLIEGKKRPIKIVAMYSRTMGTVEVAKLKAVIDYAHEIK